MALTNIIVTLYLCMATCYAKIPKRSHFTTYMCLSTFRSIPSSLRLNQSITTKFNQHFQYPNVNNVIQNLPEYIDQIVLPEGSNCLVDIVNFENINLPHINHLVLIRRPFYCLVKANYPKHELRIRFQNPLVLNTWSNYSKLFRTRSCDKFLRNYAGNSVKDIINCDLADLLRVLGYAKPWRCEASLEVYPPLRLYYPRNYRASREIGNVFGTSGFSFLYKKFKYQYVPHGVFTVPFLNVLVTNYDTVWSEKSEYLRYFLEHWMALIPEPVQGSHLFILLITSAVLAKTQVDKIIAVKQVSPCFHCIFTSEIQIQDIHMSALELAFKPQSWLLSAGYPAKQNRVHWMLRGAVLSDHAGYQTASISSVLATCGSVEGLIFYKIQSSLTSQEKLSLAYLKLLLDILTNFSFPAGQPFQIYGVSMARPTLVEEEDIPLKQICTYCRSQPGALNFPHSYKTTLTF